MTNLSAEQLSYTSEVVGNQLLALKQQQNMIIGALGLSPSQESAAQRLLTKLANEACGNIVEVLSRKRDF